MLSKEFITTLLPQAFEVSALELPNHQHGKVRDWYSLPGHRRLFITTDRLSAFDRNLACVPYKGQVLNQLSAWWFDRMADIIPNAKISIPDPNAVEMLEVEPILVEVIVRGYITGVTSTALWYRYSLGERDIYGIHFKDGLKKNEQLIEPIITPTTKGEPGSHDERLTCSEVVENGYLDRVSWDQIMEAALAIFKRGQEIAGNAGMILVDTKYEFGKTADGQIVLIDEVNTPDSSRFWQADTYFERFTAGEEPDNYDKEFVRRYYVDHGYRGEGEPPQIPDDLWVQTSQRYIDIYERLTGLTFDPGIYPINPRLIKNLQQKGFLK
jgi:phosphoribosylaminoimidazole-succinocarboxamide synthase